MPPRLGVYKTVGEAFRLTFRNFRTMLGLALAPMALAVLLPAVLRIDFETESSSWLYIINAIGQLFLLTSFSVAWHRYLLLGTRDTNVAVQFWPGMRDLRYFGIAVLFLLPQEIILIAVHIEDLVLPLVLTLITLCVAAPFSLAFPAIAVDNYQGLLAARRALRGATLQLVGAFLLSYVAVVIVLFLLGGVIGSLVIVSFGPGAMMPFFSALTFLTAGLPVAVLTVAYRKLTAPGLTGGPAGGPPPTA